MERETKGWMQCEKNTHFCPLYGCIPAFNGVLGPNGD